MADKKGVSIITVERAYAMLEEEGYLTAKQRSGYFVAHIDAIPNASPLTEKAPISHVKETHELPRDRDFEYSLWFKTLRKVISERGEELFVKSPSKGCAILRNAISDYLYRYRGMIADPHRIIIG